MAEIISGYLAGPTLRLQAIRVLEKQVDELTSSTDIMERQHTEARLIGLENLHGKPTRKMSAHIRDSLQVWREARWAEEKPNAR